MNLLNIRIIYYKHSFVKWLIRARKRRLSLAESEHLSYDGSVRIFYARLAQLVERHIDVVDVIGSSPMSRTRQKKQTALLFCARVRVGAMFLRREKHARRGRNRGS